MRHRIAALMLGFAALAAGCTTATGTPATAPTVPETLAPTTTTPPPTTTTVTLATTTTVDRLSEIQAIFEDLEHRRLKALYAEDGESFEALFVDSPYRELSLEILEISRTGDPPKLETSILEVLRDDTDCLVIVTSTTVSDSGDRAVVRTTTLQPLEDGWGYAYVQEGTEGWLCTGPHPLSG